MASGTMNKLEYTPERRSVVSNKTEQIFYSVGVMAYNEETNIRRTLLAICNA